MPRARAAFGRRDSILSMANAGAGPARVLLVLSIRGQNLEMCMSRILSVIAIILVTMGAGFAQKPANEAAERAAIQAVLDAHGAAWTKGDAKAAAAVMTEDADWVSGDGSTSTGRAAIENDHRQALSGFAKAVGTLIRARPRSALFAPTWRSSMETATWPACTMRMARKCRLTFQVIWLCLCRNTAAGK